MTIETSYSSAINTSSLAVAQHSASIKYQQSLTEPDTGLLDELINFYETEKQKLQGLWDTVKAKGEDFFAMVYSIVENLLSEFVRDIKTFIKRHKIAI